MKKSAIVILATLLAAVFACQWANTLPDLREEIPINGDLSLYHEFYAPRAAGWGPDPPPGRSLVFLVESGSKNREQIEGAVWQDFQAAPQACRFLSTSELKCLQALRSVYWRSTRNSYQWHRWNLESDPDLFAFLRTHCSSNPQFTEVNDGKYKRLRGPNDIFVSDSPMAGCWLPYEVESVILEDTTLRMKRAKSIDGLPETLIYSLVPDDGLFGRKWVFDVKKTEAASHQ